MLIISKNTHKDYYDGVVGTVGIDKTIIYDRKLIEFQKNDIPNIFQRTHWGYYSRKKNDNKSFGNLHDYSIKGELMHKLINHFIVGFCGKLYVGWKLYHEIKNQYNTELITEITYDLKYVKSILSNKYNKNIDEDLNYVVNYNIIQLFRDYKSPIFVYDSDYDRKSINRFIYTGNNRFFVNPLLKDYEFYKVFDTFQAFQEIQMFMGGVLGSGEKEIIQVDDKYKIEQHGFDLKTSFRKDKEIKK